MKMLKKEKGSMYLCEARRYGLVAQALMNLKSSNLDSSKLDAINALNAGIPTQQNLCGFNHKGPFMLKSESESEFW